jgi:adenine-specific DNA-methyltransferase
LVDENIFDEDDNTLTIYFTYESTAKKEKQKKLRNKSFDTLKEESPSKWLTELLRPKPTKKNKDRTLLEKHLKDYTARNTFDYFIHKNLGKFLRRELDFYIKNDILHIDDINLDEQESYQQSLQVVKAFKKVGLKIIDFLAQIEDFQKKLWLKKKFVLQSDYCITLDRIYEKFYEDIAQNEAQCKEWTKLYAIDELDDYSEPLTVEFLKNNPFLMVDTQFYNREWKYKLLSTLDHLDKQTDGLMINSENFQALKFIENKYREKIDGIYIDPPYNTSASKILYKNSYRHSSWLSLIENRLTISLSLLKTKGIHFFTIDDFEAEKAKSLLNQTFPLTQLIRNQLLGYYQFSKRGFELSVH